MQIVQGAVDKAVIGLFAKGRLVTVLPSSNE